MYCDSMIALPNLTVYRIEKMNEGRGNNDASTKVSREEIDNQWNLEPSHSFCEDREEGDGGGDDQDDEESRYTCTEMAIVIVPGRVESADDLSRICSRQIDIIRVKVGRERHDVPQRKTSVAESWLGMLLLLGS
jgi:hypothetical protein